MRLKIAAAMIVAIGAVAFWQMASAGAVTQISQQKISLIKEHCVENLAALNRLHQTDAFLRTDRGNLYRTIGDKLMVPLNRRLASNQLNGGELVDITAEFDQEYGRFYDAYIAYDNALTDVLDLDCTKQPVEFYNTLLDARAKRIQLSAINQKLKDLIRSYGATFVEFKRDFLKEHS
jgi:hypothetical protein